MFSGGPALAAARPRSRCVFCEGCPVVRVHLSFGFAPHTGQRTDNVWLSDPDFKGHHQFASYRVGSDEASHVNPRHVDS